MSAQVRLDAPCEVVRHCEALLCLAGSKDGFIAACGLNINHRVEMLI